MAEKSVKLRADQTVRRYVGIDVTEAVDTLAFGQMWNANFGWRNLLLDLKADPADAQRRVDTAHPKLPIKRLEQPHGGIKFADTCLMPDNINGKGADASYTVSDLKASDDFMQTFILRPSADVSTSALNDAGTGAVADVVYLSSHGYHSGEMWSLPGVMADAYLFEPAVNASLGRKFAGPGWLVLANCGTVDDATHENWTQLMSGPTPLRGVLGYRETCPLEHGSIDVAAIFIDRLAKGATILSAWKAAVSTKVAKNAWAVLCHDSAKDDTMADWNAGSLKVIGPTSKVMRFDDSFPAGTPVVKTPEPFEAFWSKGATRVNGINMTEPANHINAGDTVTITVKPTAPATTFSAGTVIAVRVIYIRANYEQKVDVNAMFKVLGQSGASAPVTSHTNTFNPVDQTAPDTWTMTVSGTPADVTLTLKCLDFSSLGHPKMPLRLRVDNGSDAFLFVRNGSVLQR